MYNIEDGEIKWYDIKRMNLTDEEIEKYHLKYGDVLVNRVNSRKLVGKAAPIPQDLDTCVFESKNMRLRLNTEIARPEYVAYWIKIFKRQYFEKKMKQTTGQATITQTQLKSMPIPIPDLPTQNKIVSQVETIKSNIINTKDTVSKEIKRANNLRKSLLEKAYEGEIHNYKSIESSEERSSESIPNATEQLTLNDV